MIEKNNPNIDVSELTALVRKEIDRMHEQCSREGSAGNSDGPPGESNNPYEWSQLTPTLQIAQQNADVGTQLSTMLNYRRSIRWLARLVGKAVLYFGRVITVPQRDFNNSLLHAFRITLNGIRDMNRSTDQFVSRTENRMDQYSSLTDRRLQELEDRDREKSHLINYLKSSLIMQERRISMFIDEARQSLPEPFSEKQLQTFQAEKEHMLDPLYVTFEDKFRGSRAEIRERLKEHLAVIRDSGAGTSDRPVLDLGSGRGEWLELLRDVGMVAGGVDLNDTLAEQCREAGLEVVIADGLSHLRSLAENSLGAVTGFHIIEHLPLRTLLEIYDEALRVLKPGGVALFETPNPQNLLVGACNFYADPTHKRPLYPETQQFLLEYRGFSKVKLVYLHPHDKDQRLPENEAPELAKQLNNLLSCARDYAIIGFKP